ncbi:band 4.1-like protein 4 [Xenentodon cancila]
MMMTCFRGNREEFYGEILLLDGRKMMLTSEQGIKKSSKVASILHQVFSHLKLVEVEFFGLRFCDDKQRTHWLDPSRTLSQHQELVGPPYFFYFGVKFYAEDPLKLQETTRCQFYLQVRQDVRRGVLPCPAHLRARLSALMLQAERGNHAEDKATDSDNKEEVQNILKTLSGISRPQAQSLFLSLCSSLQMYGVSLFAAYGENHTEYFLGPTPVGVVIFKNKELVGKYFWQRISKLHFKDETFELRVCCRNGSEMSFVFQTLDRRDCKRLWRCCVEHHAFFRGGMLMNTIIFGPVKLASIGAEAHTVHVSGESGNMLRLHVAACSSSHSCSIFYPCECRCSENQCSDIINDIINPHRCVCEGAAVGSADEAQSENVKPSAPWENNSSVSGLFNPKFRSNTREEEQAARGPERRSRSLDGERPIRRRKRRSHSRGNTSSGSESEKMANNVERRQTKSRSHHSNQGPECRSRPRTRSRSLDAQMWKHIQYVSQGTRSSQNSMLQNTEVLSTIDTTVTSLNVCRKQWVEPDGLIDRQTEEIPYKEVR